VAHAQPTSPPAPLQGRCVPLLSTPLPIPWRRVERILTASQRLFSTQAYDEIAIEDLAAAAGMSKGLLYHYFESKRDLYVATVAHVLRQMAHFTDFSPDLHAGLSQMLSLFEQSPGLAKLVLRGGVGVDREVEGLLDAYRQQQLQRLFRGLGSLGDFADASTDAAGAQALVVLGLRGWLGLLDEVCLHWVQQPDVTREQVVRFLELSLQAIVAATTASLTTASLTTASLTTASLTTASLTTASLSVDDARSMTPLTNTNTKRN
jgi:AcrR family transcriptional regulator